MITSISRSTSTVPYKVRWLIRAMRANRLSFEVFRVEDLCLSHAYWIVLSFSRIDGLLLLVSSALSVPVFPYKLCDSVDDLHDYIYDLVYKLPKNLYQ